MLNAVLNQENGFFCVGDFPIYDELPLSLFLQRYSDARLLYGTEGNVKYCVPDKVSMYGEIFWMCVIFNNGAVKFIQFISTRCDGLAWDEYVDRIDMEFSELNMLLEKELLFTGVMKRPRLHEWKFYWGEINLIHQIQDETIYIGLSWDRSARLQFRG